MARNGISHTPRVIALFLGAVALLFLGSVWNGAVAQSRKEAAKEPVQKDPFSRPAPREQQKPEIPGANRYQEDKVFLEQADSLFRPERMTNLPFFLRLRDNGIDLGESSDIPNVQIVKGTVKFRQGGMWMFCDSAYYYPDYNSMDAFGHVRMEQGDTLFVFADKLYYDGERRRATLTHGPSRGEVELRNRNVRLVTDSLDYDLNEELGWYTNGGKLADETNTLTSNYGQYSPRTKDARFQYSVVLVNNDDGYTMYSEDLDYNTDNKIAQISTATRIEGKNDTIITTQGWYNTVSGQAELTARSVILHSDSANNVVTLEGDSIVYDKSRRLSRAFSFGEAWRNPKPMVLTDTARKVILIGGYGEYDDSTRSALATQYPILIEFSRPDTLFLRADTILSRIRTELQWPDSLLAEHRRMVEERKALADSLAAMSKAIPDSLTASGDSVTGTDSHAAVVGDSIALPEIAPLDSALRVPRDYHLALAWPRGRFFNSDIQGVADTIRYEEFDSLLYLERKPAVWSGDRQVYGNRILVHFNDSTADRAYLPLGGMVGEFVAEDFYNQLSGSEMTAYIADSTLRRLDVNGSVQTIFLPQENDSSYNKLVNAESSYLILELEDGKMQNLKMWPEVTGTVTPLFDVTKRDQMFLPGFVWLEAIRPKRSWYGNRLIWEDDLGEVPDALDEYFKEGDLIRAVAPASIPTSLPKVIGRGASKEKGPDLKTGM